VGEGFGAVWPSVSQIEGWLSKEQAAALYHAAGKVQPGQWIVEIGSHHGRSTVALAKGKPDSVGMLAIDPFLDPARGHGVEAYDAFLHNLHRLGLDQRVHLFRGTSQQAAESFGLILETLVGPDTGRPGIGLLFVDGLHDRNSVLADMDGWEPLVVDGGLAFFHDAFFRVGVTLALLQRHVLDSWFVYEGSVGNLAMFRRVPAARGKDTALGALRLASRLGYFGRQMVTKLAVHRNWSPVLKLFPPEDDFEY
jgi:predicted O-methyltransferase YrrM